MPSFQSLQIWNLLVMKKLERENTWFFQTNFFCKVDKKAKFVENLVLAEIEPKLL